MKINSAEVKNLEPVKTIAIKHLGDYSGIGEPFEKLAAWAGINNLWAASPKMAGVYHDDPTNTPIQKLRSKACIEDLSGIEPGEGMIRYSITGGKYFVMQVEITMHECNEAWKKTYTTFNEKGYEYDLRDHYDLYISCMGDEHDPKAVWLVDICIPAK